MFHKIIVLEIRKQEIYLFSTTTVPEFLDPVFAKTSPKRSFLLIETSVLGVFSRKLGL
jgi:hypothetical protein